MKTGKRIIPLLVFCIFLYGCAVTPTKYVNSYLKEFRKNLQETYMAEDSDLVQNHKEISDLLKELIKDFDYKVGKETLNGNSAEVEVTIQAYAMGEAFEETLTEYITEAMTALVSGDSDKDLTNLMYEIWEEKILEYKAKGKTYSETLKLKMNKNGKEWVMQEDSTIALINAATGNLWILMQTYAEAFQQ